MADIVPFRALRYDLPRLGDAAALLAPPYDVIGEADRQALEARHANNAVHIDLPRGEGDAKYAHAAALLRAWVADGTLRRDDTPALYRYRQVFSWPESGAGARRLERRGFVAMLKLEPLAARVVLPHEHTLAGPKADRLALMRATHAHFSQVFGLYRDPEGQAEAALSALESQAPLVDARTPDGCRHTLWALTDPTAIAGVVAHLRGRAVMIADGHHRYETMLALREELRPAGAPPGSSQADFGTVFLARAEDPGLLVLPTHRLVRMVAGFDATTLIERARACFEVEEGPEADAGAIEARLARQGATRPAFAVRIAGRGPTLWLTLRDDADLSALGPAELRRLDVTVLHSLVLGPMLGIDKESMAKQKNLLYTHDMGEALGAVARAEVQAAFLMNATKVDEVLRACEAGFVLPQKSTYFQPKLATGLVFAAIDPTAPASGL